MKKISTYIILHIFVLVYLSQSIANIYIFIEFKIHQDYIAKEFCVQKEIEENKCQGCCQLKKEIEKNENKQSPILLNFQEINIFIKELV